MVSLNPGSTSENALFMNKPLFSHKRAICFLPILRDASLVACQAPHMRSQRHPYKAPSKASGSTCVWGIWAEFRDTACPRGPRGPRRQAGRASARRSGVQFQKLRWRAGGREPVGIRPGCNADLPTPGGDPEWPLEPAPAAPGVLGRPAGRWGGVAGKTDPSRWGYRASRNSAGWGGAKPLLSPLG